MTRIAVDAMGGDHAPPAIVDGAIAAARRLGIAVSLVGASGAIEQALNRHPGWRNAGLTIIDAPDVIDMAESPTAVRHKPRASIRVAADLVARGEAVALFSAGHTGATVMATHAAFGMIARRRSAGAGDQHPHPRRIRGAARCGRKRGVPASASAAIRSYGSGYARLVLGASVRASACCRLVKRRRRATISPVRRIACSRPHR
jgi:glycerol-3-phosphate acyltransferase PlsX